MKKIINDYKIDRDWISVSKGNWSFLSCARYTYYTSDLIVLGKKFSEHCVQICSGERSETWFVKSEIDAFGERIKHINTQEKINELLGKLITSAESTLELINSVNIQEMDYGIFDELWRRNKNYHQYHLTVKYLGEYLNEEQIKEFGGQLEEARKKYGEPTQWGLEQLTRKWLNYISNNTGIDIDLLKYVSPQELKLFFQDGTLPTLELMQQRREKTLILGTPTGYIFITGKEADKIEKVLYKSNNMSNILHGSSAFEGTIEGVARIIENPNELGEFQDGDILVTGMTHIDYIPLVKKAAAIVTDAGGVLSHAAIIARELEKPCVVGTKNATKRIKDGQRIKVDAVNGIINLL